MAALVSLLLLLAGLARAEDDPPVDFRGGIKTARAGLYTSTAGLSVGTVAALGLTLGLARDAPGLTTVGGILTPQGALGVLVGVPLASVGGLRAARAVEAAGGEAPFVPGALALGLCGGATVAAVTGLTDRWWFDDRARVWAPVTGGLLAGSVWAASVQYRQVRRAGEAVGLRLDGHAAPPDAELPQFWIRAVPTVVGERPGVLLAGGF